MKPARAAKTSAEREKVNYGQATMGICVRRRLMPSPRNECDMLARSKQTFLVCTSDISALHVARTKSNRLLDLDLAVDVAAILSCVQRRKALPLATLESVIQMPIRYLVPAGANEIARMAERGQINNGSSPLAKPIGRIVPDMPFLQKNKFYAPLRRISFRQSGVRCAEWIKIQCIQPEKQA